MKRRLSLIAISLFFTVSLLSQGIFDSAIHEAVPFGNVDSPANETAQQVIDQDPTTKFLDFSIGDGIGFEVDLLGEGQVAVSMEIVTANDAPERDPTNYEIYGSMDGITFDSVSFGTIPCVDDRFLARIIAFENAIAYSFYRFVFSGVCSPSSINQIADVQLYTSVGNVPTFTCPEDITLDNASGLCGAPYTYSVSVEDIEDGELTAVLESGLAADELFPVGINTVIWSAEDSDGNKVSCTFTVTVLDMEAPVCPETINIFVAEGETGAEVVYDLSLTDNCTVIDTIPNFIPIVTLEGESYYLSNTFFNPEDAFFDAVVNGGWLGTIRDETYNEVISSTIRRFVGNFEVLIGLNDLNQEGTFTWQNEDPSTYRNWQENEPNDANDNEDYVIMKPNGEWNDVSGTENPFPYLMQKTYQPTQIEGLESGAFFPLGVTTNTFELVDIYGNATTCSFDVVVQTLSDVDEEGLAEGISISPNPTSGVLTVEYKGTAQVSNVSIYNSLGVMIKRQQWFDTMAIDLSHVENGVYFIQFETQGKFITKQIIKI